MIELTDADRKWIAAVRTVERTVEWALAHQRDDHAEVIAKHFLAAGIERAAQALDDTNPQLRPSGCAIVIRALLK